MKKTRILEIKEWYQWRGILYNTHLPQLFTFECADPADFKDHFNWRLLLERDGPCRDHHGAHHFFGTEANAREVLECPTKFAIRVRENSDSWRNWNEAVYEIQREGTSNVWVAKLLLVNKDHPEDLSKPEDHHLSFELKGLSDTTLEVTQNIQDEVGKKKTREGRLTLFDKTTKLPSPRLWL